VSLLSFIIEARDDASKIINNVKQSFSGMGSLLGGLKGQILSAFTVGAVVSFGKSVVDYVGQIKDASDATGIASDRFQALAIAAKTNGVGMDQLAGSIARLRNLQGSIGSDEGIQKTFSKIGMSISDVQAANPEQLLAGIARGLNETGDASVAFDVFGRGAAGLLTTLKELENGWDPLVEKMKSGIISKEDIEQIDEFGDKLDTLAIKAKSFGAGMGIGLVGLGKIIGGLFTGQAPGDVLGEMADERIANVKKNEDRKKLMEEARKASEKMAIEEAEANKTKISMDAAQKEGQGLGDQFAKANMSDNDYAARLEEKSIALAAAANEEGLTALDRQTRMNEALKVEIELRTLQKKILDDNNRKGESLMKRDRDLREMMMTPDQKRDASLQRQAGLEQQLAAEKDPGKKLDIQAKIMDESEKQISLSKRTMHSLSVGDLFMKKDKSGGKSDPAHEQVDVLRRVELLLKDIKNKPGGMTK
jgi:hypothetical protein